LVVIGALALSSFAAGATEEGRSAAARDLADRYPGLRVHMKDSRPVSVYGRPITTGRTPVESAEMFRWNEVEIFGITPNELRPESTLFDGRHTQPLLYDRDTGEYRFTLVYYTQYAGDLPVFRSDLRVLVRNETGFPVVLVNSSVRDLSSHELPAPVDEVRSDLARQAVLARNADMVTFTDPRTVVWAGGEGEVVGPRVAVVFEAADDRADSDHEELRFVCDAVTGEILYEETLVHFTDVTGDVQAIATPGAKAAFCTEEIPFVYPWAEVEIVGGETVYTDAQGNFTIPNDGTSEVTVKSYVDGIYFDVDNWAGAEETLTALVVPPGPIEFIHNAPNVDDLVLSQVNVYVAGNDCRDWVLAQNPSFPGIATETGVPTIVNRTDFYCPCNAWSSGMDGSINFCQAGSGCPNTGWQSVLNHEYGHHCIDFTGSGQGEYGEGMSDCFSMLPVDDPNLGYGFSGDCNSGLRTADNDCQYLEVGCSTCGSAIHDCGMLLSGIVWSIRNELVITEPIDYLEILSSIVVNSILLHSGTSIDEQIAIDFLTLDDAMPGGDGNINNGTPHWDEICAGFSAHGLECPALPEILFSYPEGLPSLVVPTQPHTIDVDVEALVEDPVPGTGKLHYRIGGGSFISVGMTETSPNHYKAELPGAECGETIEYYFSADAASAGSVTDPLDAPASVYSVLSAISLIEVASYDFEGGAGWTVTGSVSDGPWERAVPITECNRGNPQADYDSSGSCYVTDNSAADNCNSDVDDGTTTLNSPTFDLSALVSPRVSYARWYSNDYGNAPYTDTFVIEISDDGGGSWVNLETVGPSGAEVEGGWYHKEFSVADFVSLSSQVRFRFHASDLGEGSVVEAGIDAFAIHDVECAPPDVPTVVNQPDSQSVCLDDTVTFTVEVLGEPPFVYMWKKDGVEIAGADQPSYTVSHATVDDEGGYSCRVTNDFGSTESDAAVLTVLTPADCDDSSLCTADSCDSGECVNTDTTPEGQCCDPLTGGLTQIDDADACTIDVCNPDGTVDHIDNYNPLVHCCNPADGGLTEIDDGDACTDDLCNPDGTVDHVENYVVGAECCNPTSGEIAPIDDGSDCTLDSCDSETGLVEHRLPAPDVADEGARSLAVTPQTCTDTVAILIESPDHPCLSLYVDVDGTLVASPVMQTPAEWGTVHVGGEQIVPDSTYTARCECPSATVAEEAAGLTFRWGDVDGNTVVNLSDVMLIVAAFQGDYSEVTREAADLDPCTPNGVINLDDIMSAVGAFQGEIYADTGCPMPCP
jgi:hypothetical protein